MAATSGYGGRAGLRGSASKAVLAVASLVALVAGTVAAITLRDQGGLGDDPVPVLSAPAALPEEASPAAAASAWPLLDPPEEFLPVAEGVAQTGVLSLDDVVRLDGSDATLARARFVALGFQGAVSRAWQSPEESLVVVAYAFADERGAATFAGEASARRREDPGATALPLPGLPGASAFQLQVPGEPTQAAFVVRGTRAYLVGLVGPAAADPQARLLQRLAVAQYDAAL